LQKELRSETIDAGETPPADAPDEEAASAEEAALEARKAWYRPGYRVELVRMSDPFTSLKPGDGCLLFGI